MVGKGRRIQGGVKPAFDLAGVGQVVGLGVPQRFPGPGEDIRLAAGYLQGQVVVVPLHGRSEHGAALTVVKKSVEGLFAPLTQALLNSFCHVRIRSKGIVEKIFQIPTQVFGKIAVGAALHRKLIRR